MISDYYSSSFRVSNERIQVFFLYLSVLILLFVIIVSSFCSLITNVSITDASSSTASACRKDALCRGYVCYEWAPFPSDTFRTEYVRCTNQLPIVPCTHPFARMNVYSFGSTIYLMLFTQSIITDLTLYSFVYENNSRLTMIVPLALTIKTIVNYCISCYVFVFIFWTHI